MHYKPQRLCWLTLSKMKPQIRISFNLFTSKLSSQNFSDWPVRVVPLTHPLHARLYLSYQLSPFLYCCSCGHSFQDQRHNGRFISTLLEKAFWQPSGRMCYWPLHLAAWLAQRSNYVNWSTLLLKRTWFICVHKFISWREWNRKGVSLTTL